MLDRFQSLVRSYLPITVAPDDAARGPRIGGRAPERVVPRYVDEHTRYLVTLPLNDIGSVEISIFYSLVQDWRSARSGLATWRSILPPDSDLVEAVIHEPRSRCDSGLESDLTPHALIIGDAQPEPEDENPFFSGYDGDKMGGVPRYDQNKEPIISEARTLMNSGFVHFLQLNSIDAAPALLRGRMWPFGNHVFHTWVRYAGGGFEVRFGWA